MLNGNPYVVHNSTNEYIKLTDNSLKKEFDAVYRKERNIMGRYWSPISDMRGFEQLMGILVSGINPFSPPLLFIDLPLPFQTPGRQEVYNAATIRHYNNLNLYYKQYNIIK